MFSNLYPRYERHIELANVGESGQRKLLSARILVIGVGGIGCPVVLYLAAAGVGRITIADDDNISLTNLQRQILYRSTDLGLPKVERAVENLKKLNSDVAIVPLNVRVTPENLEPLIQDHDLVVDCSDNFDTRYMVNFISLRQKKTLISGAVIYFDGQVYISKCGQQYDAPCYRCLYPVQPDAHETPACRDSAVLGPVPGVIGTIMAVEAIKEILDIGQSLAGYFITYSALDSSFRKVKIEKNKSCLACSDHKTIVVYKEEKCRL